MLQVFGKLDLNELVNLKTKLGDLDVGEMKTVPIDLKKLNNVVSKEVVKKTV